MAEVDPIVRAQVIEELRQQAKELAKAGRNAVPGVCGTMQSWTNGVMSPPEPCGLYSEERTLEALAGVFLFMLAAAEGIELYRPSNGTEGEFFQDQFCANCARDKFDHATCEGESCPIMMATMALDITDPGYPREWRQDGPEGPRCTAFLLREGKADA